MLPKISLSLHILPPELMYGFPVFRAVLVVLKTFGIGGCLFWLMILSILHSYLFHLNILILLDQ